MAEVDSALINQIEELLTTYKIFYDQHFLKNKQDVSHESVGDELELLEDLLETVQSQLVKSLQNLIPDVRALVKPSSDLSNLIKKYQESSFSVQNLELCFKTVESTREALSEIVKLAAAKNLTKKTADDQVFSQKAFNILP